MPAPSAGRVAGRHCCLPAPSEPYMKLSLHTAQAWANAPRRTRFLPRRPEPQRLAVIGATRRRLGASVPTRFHLGVPLLPGRPWREFETPTTPELYHGAAASPGRGPPPLAGRDLHDTRLEQTNHVTTVEGRTSKRCRRRHFCVAPSSLLARFSRDARPEGSQPAFAWGHVTTPIRTITERPSLAPSSSTRRPIGLPCGSLSLAGGLRAYHVPPT
jgi:hypothetical protein